jgi:hypothetical protein
LKLHIDDRSAIRAVYRGAAAVAKQTWRIGFAAHVGLEAATTKLARATDAVNSFVCSAVDAAHGTAQGNVILVHTVAGHDVFGTVMGKCHAARNTKIKNKNEEK